LLCHVPFVEAESYCRWLMERHLPHGHGKYLPALTMLKYVLGLPAPVPVSNCNVAFFSDGRPSDPSWCRGGVLGAATARACADALSSLPPNHFSFHAVGFGAAPGEFARLHEMVEALPQGVGHFHLSGLRIDALRSTLTAFSASVTQTRLTSTTLQGGKGAERLLRPVQWDARASEWLTYRGVTRLHAPPSFDAEWETEAETLTLLVSRGAFDGGGERNVFHAQFEGSQFEWVAKEGKHIDPGGYEAEVEFHKRSLVTQATCAAWAGEFNYAVDQLGIGLPPIEVNRCFLVVVDGRPLFVEPKIKGAFHKWNSNQGHVFPSNLAAQLSICDVGGHGDEAASIDDVSQAFSHWSYAASKGTRLVCDLQGFFTGGRFVLVDPVIHSCPAADAQPLDHDAHAERERAERAERGAFGRTDRGAKGMADFLRSHECNALCRRLHLPPATVESVPSRRICVICEDLPREVRFPCGHACACRSCADLVRRMDNLCPTCRKPLGSEPFAPVGSDSTTYVRKTSTP
jgi:hypothetical protein